MLINLAKIMNVSAGIEFFHQCISDLFADWWWMVSLGWNQKWSDVVRSLFSQWQHSFHLKLCCHWLEDLHQHPLALITHQPGLQTQTIGWISFLWNWYLLELPNPCADITKLCGSHIGYDLINKHFLFLSRNLGNGVQSMYGSHGRSTITSRNSSLRAPRRLMGR